MAAPSSLSLFVIAHPDDESMFFLPTITHIKTPKVLLCLSNGNYDGLGKTREVELHKACGLLQMDQIKIIEHPQLQDGKKYRWDATVISEAIQQFLQEMTSKLSDQDMANVHIYTFDMGGVSGHINHTDTYLGVQHFLRMKSTSAAVVGWELQTIENPVRKYVPVYHWFVLIFWVWLLRRAVQGVQMQDSGSYVAQYRPVLNWKCMAAHNSQFVWYRRLFVVFSCYTYENRWKEIEKDPLKC